MYVCMIRIFKYYTLLQYSLYNCIDCYQSEHKNRYFNMYLYSTHFILH